MLLTKFGPAFHETWKVPRGVAWALPGGPGSARTGPKVTRPADWSQVRCPVRSTQAVALAGQDSRSSAVSVRGDGGAGCAAAGAGTAWWRGAFPVAVCTAALRWAFDAEAVARRTAGRGEATAAPVTTTVEAAATVSRTARRRADSRLRTVLAGSACPPTCLNRLAVVCLLLACISPPSSLATQTRTSNYLQLAHP